jgi:hypothetical protein
MAAARYRRRGGANPELSDLNSRTYRDEVAGRDLLRFPNPVNEISARLVAAGVVVEAVAFLVTGWPVWLVTLAVGFVLRVLAGPRLSPLALVITKVVVPRLDVVPKLVPGPPKRFAQGIGATLSVVSLAAWLLGSTWLATALVALIAIAATLESVFAICIGCKLFAALVRAGVIPASVCEECADISEKLRTHTSSTVAG